jgi:HD-GYP domain-containing protein (c-di-GMP phosphodiesterase class II)
MSSNKQHRRSALDALRGHMGKGPESASALFPLSESQQEALLKAIPDFIFRISLRRDGATITGNGLRLNVPNKAVADSAGQSGEMSDSDDRMRSLAEELARQGETLMAEYLRTAEVQMLELQVEYDGQTTYYEVRAAVCDTKEVLALVRDVTALREAEGSIAASRDELARLNELLKNEASLRTAEEDILKKSFQRLQKLLEDTVEAIALIVHKKDSVTARHQERVSRLACAIGQEMGLDSRQVDVIGLAALLHDLGMIFVPSDTLEKPGKLSKTQQSAIQDHAEAEFQILKTIDLFCPVAEIVHQHHERLDGSGYPAGLKGDDILLEARVLAVADVVEAMMSDRPHRQAPGIKAAMTEIASGKGTLYDASVVDACIRLFDQGKFELDDATADPAAQEPSSENHAVPETTVP